MEELVAPDITSVSVSNTPGGVITFTVTVANHAALPPRSRMAILFDLDRSQSTGFGGFEYSVKHETDATGQAEVVFERWDGDALEFVTLPTDTLTSRFADGVYTFSIPRRQLQNTKGFAFGMYAAALNDAAISKSAVDDAPNTELWLYELTGLPAPRLATTRLARTPTKPSAGRVFTVHAGVRDADTGAALTAASVTCTARIGSAKVRVVGRFSGGRARCLVTVPRSAKGKTLRGTITVRSAGATVRRSFSYRVV
jgi:hypothetical protein